MSTPRSLRLRTQPALLNYGVAVLAVTAALAIARLLQLQYGFEPWNPFLCAILLSAVLGGAGPGLFAVALSLLAFDYYFLVPNPLGPEKDIPRLLVAAVTALVIVLLSSARNRAEGKALQLAQKLQAASAQEEAHLRLAIDSIPTMVWTLLPEGSVEFVNQRWLDYSGLSLDEALKDANRIVHPEDLPAILQSWPADKAAGRSCEYEMRFRRADGSYRWFLVRTVPLRDERGHIVKWYGASTDIEDRKRAEEALRALSRRLVELQESERKKLARELHDRVGQGLTALNINLTMLAATLPPQANGELRARLADSQVLLESTMAAIGDVASELHPPMLGDHGLVPALEWYTRQFSARTGVLVRVRGVELDPRPAPEKELVFFRIAQEALNNVVKHASASRVEIALERSASEYVMSVQDDGVGLPAAHEGAAPHSGLGMVTMRERAESAGGRFEAAALRGGGTRLTVRVPV